MARLLAGTDVAPIDDRLGRRAGMLLARSGQSDAIDAAVVCLAADGDDIIMVASDRVSVYDVVLPTPIPGKGRVLR